MNICGGRLLCESEVISTQAPFQKSFEAYIDHMLKLELQQESLFLRLLKIGSKCLKASFGKAFPTQLALFQMYSSYVEAFCKYKEVGNVGVADILNFDAFANRFYRQDSIFPPTAYAEIFPIGCLVYPDDYSMRIILPRTFDDSVDMLERALYTPILSVEKIQDYVSLQLGFSLLPIDFSRTCTLPRNIFSDRIEARGLYNVQDGTVPYALTIPLPSLYNPEQTA